MMFLLLFFLQMLRIYIFVLINIVIKVLGTFISSSKLYIVYIYLRNYSCWTIVIFGYGLKFE